MGGTADILCCMVVVVMVEGGDGGGWWRGRVVAVVVVVGGCWRADYGRATLGPVVRQVSGSQETSDLP